MHETFKIIEPYLNENGIWLCHISCIEPLWVARRCAYALDTGHKHDYGELRLMGSMLYVEPIYHIWEDNRAHGEPKFDLYDPESLDRLVKWILWRHKGFATTAIEQKCDKCMKPLE